MKISVLLSLVILGVALDATAECVLVDGPANIRESATLTGKIARSIPAGSAVEVSKSENEDWRKVEYFWDGKIATCSDPKDDAWSANERKRVGFIHWKNILKKSYAEVFAVDPCGATSLTGEQGQDGLTGTLIADCKCSRPYDGGGNDVGGCETKKVSKGTVLGRDCLVANGTILCKGIECLASCAKTEKTKLMTAPMKRAAFEKEIPKARARMKEKLGEKPAKALSLKYPGWLPLITSYVAEPKFDYAPVTVASIYRGPLVLGSKTRDVVFAVFFETIELALKGSAHWILLSPEGEILKEGTILSLSTEEARSLVQLCLIPTTPGPFKTSLLFVSEQRETRNEGDGYCRDYSGLAVIDFERFDRPLEPVNAFGGKGWYKTKKNPITGEMEKIPFPPKPDDSLRLESGDWFERTGLKSCEEHMTASACAPLVGGNEK